MKKVAIIGAGLAGLGVAFQLVMTGLFEVTLFDPLGVGKGASGAASGLAHPYAGELVRRSLHATEALEELKMVLKILEGECGFSLGDLGGVFRFPQNDAQKQMLLAHSEKWGDVHLQENSSFWISSGVTLHTPTYLQALYSFIEKRGGKLEQKTVGSLSELEDFDFQIVTAGYGSLKFKECSHFSGSLVKGQIWTGKGKEGLLDKSSVGKGYVALGEFPGIYYLGSTYERQWEDTEPLFERGLDDTLSKLETFFPEVKELKITDCRGGIRFIRKGHHFPFLERIGKTSFAVTGLGSRGILYHAYLGKQLVGMIT